MPTPSDETIAYSPGRDHEYRHLHTTCPPDSESQRAGGANSLPPTHTSPVSVTASIDAALPEQESIAHTTDVSDDSNRPCSPQLHRADSDEESIARSTPSPLNIPQESKHVRSASVPVTTTQSMLARPPLPLSPGFFNPRPYPPFSSSLLRNGSVFAGTQKSDRQIYKVQVEIKHVDMDQSFLCGYLRIEDLTADHPTLTTFFEGEVVGDKYNFQTKHADWGSNEKVDMHHWNLFSSFRPLKAQAKRSDFNFRNYAQREHIYMRWKEYFLVPDHRVRTITGASFEGFYYICFNQKNGNIEGYYFHHKSEKHQQLKLEHVPDRGCMGAMELR